MHQNLVTVAAPGADPEGESASHKTRTVRSGEPKRCVFFLFGCKYCCFVAVYGCERWLFLPLSLLLLLLVAAVVAVVAFTCCHMFLSFFSAFCCFLLFVVANGIILS